MLIFPKDITYTEVPQPDTEPPTVPVDLTDKTMSWRRDKVLKAMACKGFDTLVIYGDREHGANFGYLAGFEPRFEEAVIILHKNGDAFMLLGNEALRMAAYSRLPVTAIHVPFFSLPNQPMDNELPLRQVMENAQIVPGAKVGILGWKMFSSTTEDNLSIFDVPYFIVESVKKVVGANGLVLNACDLFIAPEYGVRTIVNANEIAHYEFGAALASNCVLECIKLNRDREK